LPPEAESLLAFEHPMRLTKFAIQTVSRKVYFCYLIAVAPCVGEDMKLPIIIIINGDGGYGLLTAYI